MTKSEAIGPRTAGSITYSGYWKSYSRVIEVWTERDDWMDWAISEIDCDESGNPIPGARVRTHCTPWDAQRDHLLIP